jgi:hypothetical protein
MNASHANRPQTYNLTAEKNREYETGCPARKHYAQFEVDCPVIFSQCPAFEYLQATQIRTQASHLSAPTVRNTPINECNDSMPLLTCTFPSPFPFGRPDYVQPRLREVDSHEFIKHLIRHDELPATI